MIKPVYVAGLGESAYPALDAIVPLTLCDDSACFHTQMQLRLPLGIYNVSVARICDKVVRLCSRLELLFRSAQAPSVQRDPDDLLIEIVDYMELALYAAAEHVDDIESIASGFFRSTQLRDKSSAYKELAKQVKAHKRLVSAAANAIKHQQSRIRAFAMEFQHAGRTGYLHGYFFEAVEDGVVCPSSTFHKNQDAFSMTTLVWEILAFLLSCSRDLAGFMHAHVHQRAGPVKANSELFQRAVVAAARLPIYTFGEEHPFSRLTLRLGCHSLGDGRLNSGLYGSICEPWARTTDASFGAAVSRFMGDGKTTTFRFAQPKSVSFQHWD